MSEARGAVVCGCTFSISQKGTIVAATERYATAVHTDGVGVGIGRSSSSALTNASTATTPSCTTFTASGGSPFAQRLTPTTCTAYAPAHSSVNRSPSARSGSVDSNVEQPSHGRSHPQDSTASPDIETAIATATRREMRSPSRNPTIGTKTTFKPVM